MPARRVMGDWRWAAAGKRRGTLPSWRKPLDARRRTMPEQAPIANRRSPIAKNDFAFKIGTVNGTGSASANSLLMQAIFRMGIPVTGKNVFPSNIQGLPTWYEIRVSGAAYTARAAEVDIVVVLNSVTLA